jgi:hypothetical protein
MAVKWRLFDGYGGYVADKLLHHYYSTNSKLRIGSVGSQWAHSWLN